MIDTGRVTCPSGWRDTLDFLFLDHAVLRYTWCNQAKVCDDVWRSNHAGFGRLRRLRDQGIKAILTLRGSSPSAANRFEAAACHTLGLHLYSVSLEARRAPKRDEVLRLFNTFRALPRPFLMHCKSGADRAGLAGALYLLGMQGATIEQARKQLSLRYLHIRASQTGVLDHVLDLYENDFRRYPIGIEEWFATKYDRDAATESFRR
ncbi:dual specificity protein phosphatase family protein [Ketogulonicigenium vulgare]|uniref:Protein tyrosine/serine phosphatase n=1 Tax=Ketogulonicigenium vulgare (strain WSH-001) TaxID=759362 RepID=F9Y3H8_KETVW|nr:dual specificity protein phosphatase family protein [Ketogulonicigenium vulgare]ADO43309.1 protein tyrosine/serine phosphatase [Ketogulonicigenium vulgare Y25]AEM41598.1 Protein tyrosine/serine phosphatase [Ketogulonicigenium vulgare WSH-001]ALJ82396.1 protein tyrosine phosphatase [Ketogulonicigenium vulgare]ANW34379.1 protein tyrosine phosphatase [Ketogulonicigenium vulgare]AOZ55347.1 protein tyrosine/serine phosphatase [Ketogulonicigenium vulgare]